MRQDPRSIVLGHLCPSRRLHKLHTLQGEVADSLHLKNILAKIKRIYKTPHLLYSWVGSHLIDRDAPSTSDPVFKLMTVYDHIDKVLNASACVFGCQLSASMPNSTAAATHIGYIAHRDSGNSARGYLAVDILSGQGVLFDASVSGISYLIATAYSAIHIDAASTDSPRPYLRDMALYATQADYQATRYTSATYNTLLRDTDVDPTDTITTSMYNAMGRAVFNIGHARAGPVSSFCWPDGKAMSLTTSNKTQLHFSVNQRNDWVVGKLDIDFFKLHTCFCVYNGDGSNRTVTYTLETVNGDVVSGSFTAVASSYTYFSEEVQIDKTLETDTFLDMMLHVKSSVATNNIELHSFSVTPLTSAYTV